MQPAFGVSLRAHQHFNYSVPSDFSINICCQRLPIFLGWQKEETMNLKKKVRVAVSKDRIRFNDKKHNLDLSYITNNLIGTPLILACDSAAIY
jgi:hypothetical protein